MAKSKPISADDVIECIKNQNEETKKALARKYERAFMSGHFMSEIIAPIIKEKYTNIGVAGSKILLYESKIGVEVFFNDKEATVTIRSLNSSYQHAIELCDPDVAVKVIEKAIEFIRYDVQKIVKTASGIKSRES